MSFVTVENEDDDATLRSLADEMDASADARRVLERMESIDPAKYDLRRLHEALQGAAAAVGSNRGGAQAAAAAWGQACSRLAVSPPAAPRSLLCELRWSQTRAEYRTQGRLTLRADEAGHCRTVYPVEQSYGMLCCWHEQGQREPQEVGEAIYVALTDV